MSFGGINKITEEVLLLLNILTPKKRKTDFSIPILLLEQKIKPICWIQKAVVRQKAQKQWIKVTHFKNELKKNNQNIILN